MPTTNDMIEKLHDQRLTAVEALRGLVVEVEARKDHAWTTEDKLQEQLMNAEIDSLGDRIESLIGLEKQNAETDKQREAFERVVRPDGVGKDPNSVDDRLTQFMRSALPDSDTWGPKAIEFAIPQKTKDYVRAKATGSLESFDLGVGVPNATTAGGYTVPTGFLATLYEHLIEFAAIRQTNAQILTTSSGENLLVPKTTSHGAAALVLEGGTLAESDPAFGQVTLNAYKYGQLIEISTELVSDSAVDIVGYLARAAGIAIGTATGTAYVTGTGSSQPQGIANAPTAGVTGGAGTGLTVSGNALIDLYHSVVTGYRRNSYWVMNDLTAAYVRKIRDDTGGAGLGNFLWQPGMQAGQPDLLFGRPVVTDPNVAVQAVNAYSIAFGDFSQYFTIRDVAGVRFERSDDFRFNADLIAFRCILRTDSKQVVNGSAGAVKWYRNGAS
jgi:HK97 family phage major capsid protein